MFKSRELSHEFQKILNKQDKHIQFTIDNQNDGKSLNFDIKIKNNNGIYEFDAHRKPALTNVQIKPDSCISSGKISSIFKGFLARATKILFPKIFQGGNRISDFFAKMDMIKITKDN